MAPADVSQADAAAASPGVASTADAATPGHRAGDRLPFFAVTAFGNVHDSDPLAIWNGVAGWDVVGERVTLALIELDRGSIVSEHAHDNEQVGILVRGSLRFRIGDEERELAPGATWSIPSQTPHAVTTGPDGATLVEVFAPARADWGALERSEGRRPLLP